MQDFSYDPFDPAVMADPLPYYRVLRDDHPVYYLPKWDTYALSRFDDIWEVLEINDGTFVASEGTLPAATVLAHHNDGPVPDPPLHPMPFHANFDSPIYDDVRRSHSGAVPAEERRQAGRPDPRAGQRAARRTAAARRASTSPRTTAASSPRPWCANWSACQPNSPPTCWRPSTRAAWPSRATASKVANARPGYLDYLTPDRRAPPRRGRRRRAADRRRPARLPAARRLRVHRHRGRPSRCSASSSAAPRPCRRSSRTDCGNWSGTRPAGRGARRSRRQRAGRPRGDDPLLRTRAMVRPHRAQAVHHPRHHDRTRASGSSRCSRSAARDEREYPDPDEFIWNRPIERLLAFGRGQHFCLGVHLARLEIAHHGHRMAQAGARLPRRRRGRVAAAVELPVGLEQHPRRSPGGGC